MFVKPRHVQVLVGLSAILMLAPLRASAASIVQAVSPNQFVQTGLQFDVERTPETDAQSRFVIAVTPQNVPLPRQFQASLSVIQQDSHSVSIGGTSAEGGRRLDCAIGSRILCEFTLPDRDWESLSFVLDIPVSTIQNGRLVSMPSADMLYFNLKDVPPLPEAPQKTSIEQGYEQLSRAITTSIGSFQKLVQSL